MPKQPKASFDNGTEKVTRTTEVSQIYSRIDGITALEVAARVGTKKQALIRDTEYIKEIVATYLALERASVEKFASHPDVCIVYSVWNPQYKYGSPIPLIFATVEELKEKLMTQGLFPLRHGWKIVQLVVRKMPEALQVK